MNFNVICGLPRSGSTLLCELLNQREDSFASSTSPVPDLLVTLQGAMDTNEALLSLLANDEETPEKVRSCMRKFIEEWYGDGLTIFDKSRRWSHLSVLLRALYEDATIIVTVRDPRDVLASIERQHRKTGEFGGGSLFDRCSLFMSNEGIVGSCIRGVEDLIRRNYENMVIVDYDTFIKEPLDVLKEIEKATGLEAFDYDTVNINSTALDLDAQWKFKFPHKVKGPIAPVGHHWSEMISKDIAELSMKVSPYFNEVLGYK